MWYSSTAAFSCDDINSDDSDGDGDGDGVAAVAVDVTRATALITLGKQFLHVLPHDTTTLMMRVLFVQYPTSPSSRNFCLIPTILFRILSTLSMLFPH